MVMENEDYVFGTRAVIEAINAQKSIDKVLLRRGLNNELFFDLWGLVQEQKIPFQFVPAPKLNNITRKNHQGVIALLSPVEFQKPEEVLPMVFEKGKDPLFLILDQISDVRNFGAIIRSAECAGVDAIVVPEKGSAPLSADAAKTSAGALFNIPVCRSANIVSTIRFLKESGVKVIAATEKSEILFTETEMNLPLAIVMGSEEKGISKSILDACDETVRIPLFGKIESLNVSVASSLMVYEAVRQRKVH
jgi:23S rRNA (guanosine2251-2'-O)-methyltransferase